MVELLAHELRHAIDNRKIGGALYVLGYLSPQIFAVLSLLSLLAIWFGLGWLGCLAFLLCILPIPSPGRMIIERRGYAMSNACDYWLWGDISSPAQIDWSTKQFTGSGYYFMWPFKKSLQTWFVDDLRRVKENRLDAVEVLVLNFIEARGLGRRSKRDSKA
jgi:hypothetical protein